MISPLEIGLAAAFGIAAYASIILAIRLQRAERRAREASFELNQAKAREAGAEKARLAIAAEVGVVLRPLRALLEQQASAITRGSNTLGATVTAAGQRIGEFETLVMEFQGLARALNSAAEELALARDGVPETRVVARQLPAASTPHAPPVRVGPPSVRPPPPSEPPPTRRPGKAASPTLVSMRAVPAADGRGGGS